MSIMACDMGISEIQHGKSLMFTFGSNYQLTTKLNYDKVQRYKLMIKEAIIEGHTKSLRT